MHHRFGVHYVFTVAVPRPVMLFDVSHARVFAHVKGVFAIVAGRIVFTARVVNTTACNNHDVRVFANVEIVVNDLLQARLADDDGDMHTLVFCVRFDININPRFAVRLGDDIDVFRRFSAVQFSVTTDIIRALGGAVQIGYFRQ